MSDPVTKASVNYRTGQEGARFPHCGDPKTCAMFRRAGRGPTGSCHNKDGTIHVVGVISEHGVCKDWTAK